MNVTPPPVEGRGRCIAVYPGEQAALMRSRACRAEGFQCAVPTLAPLAALLGVSRDVGQNVTNLHFCPRKNDLLSRLVINGGVFCTGTERRKSGTERRKNGTERVGQNVAYSFRRLQNQNKCHISVSWFQVFSLCAVKNTVPLHIDPYFLDARRNVTYVLTFVITPRTCYNN